MLLGFALTLVQARAEGQGPERDRGRKRRRPPLPNFWDSKLARICIICKPKPMSRAAFLR